MSTPPINEYLTVENDQAKGILQQRRTADHTRLYAEGVKEVAKQQGVALLDLWAIFMKHAGFKEDAYPLPGAKDIAPNPFLRMLMHDGKVRHERAEDTILNGRPGLHFTSIAYTIFHQELMRLIITTWPDQAPEKLPFVLPMWAEPEQWEAYEAGLKVHGAVR